MMLKNSIQNCIGPHSPLQATGYEDRCSCLRLRFAQVRVATSFDGGCQGIALSGSRVLAAFDQVVGALTKFAGLALGVLATIVGTLGEEIAGLFAGLGGEKNAQERAHTESYEEKAHFGTNIVGHGNLREKRNIGGRRRQ